MATTHFTDKTTVIEADWCNAVDAVVYDVLDGSTTKAQARTALNVEDGAQVTNATRVGAAIHGATAKTTPVDTDTVPTIDSEASNVLKKVTWTNIKAFLKTYFDTLYGRLASANTWTGTNVFSGSSTPVTLSYTSESGVGPMLHLVRVDASPEDFASIGLVQYTGSNDAAEATVYAAIVGRIIDVSNGTEDGRLDLNTMVAGTVATRAQLALGFVVGEPTGGDKGVGTINAVGIYDDDSLLSDYVLDADQDGAVDTGKWDAAVPNRRHIERDEDGRVTRDEIEVRTHEPARRFAQNLDELDPVAYATKVQSTRKLPAFSRIGDDPSVGKIAQALIETCEVQAVHIRKLTERIAALEAADGGRT